MTQFILPHLDVHSWFDQSGSVRHIRAYTKLPRSRRVYFWLCRCVSRGESFLICLLLPYVTLRLRRYDPRSFLAFVVIQKITIRLGLDDLSDLRPTMTNGIRQRVREWCIVKRFTTVSGLVDCKNRLLYPLYWVLCMIIRCLADSPVSHIQLSVSSGEIMLAQVRIRLSIVITRARVQK
jgi:hypothetical protein